MSGVELLVLGTPKFGGRCDVYGIWFEKVDSVEILRKFT